MNGVIADTQAIVWAFFDVERLSPVAREALNSASLSGRIYLSSITLVEVVYLTGRWSFPYPGALARLIELANDPYEPIEVLPLTIEVAEAMERVPRGDVPDMPDRIIAATAVAHRLPLVSADSDLRGSESLKAIVPVIW